MERFNGGLGPKELAAIAADAQRRVQENGFPFAGVPFIGSWLAETLTTGMARTLADLVAAANEKSLADPNS